MLRNNKGFTLIELLIVIVIIGILAVAVLSAINPIEQINKATDQGKKSDSAELLNALERYYTTFQEYPWTKMGASGPVSGTPVFAGVSGTAQTWIGVAVGDSDTASLVGTSELKPEFARRKSLNDLKVFLYAPSSGSTNYLVRVCFLPTSKNFQLLANYTTDGVY
ncbi:MAG: prepilin-type N-terminal cleavage/methylation domain-containing protein, partial [bacterium]|nr:prepilin-type N-terminal cleavage/methylation domain-containing protein [bacterium]